MAFPTEVNGQITDAVTQSNVNLAFQNPATAQQQVDTAADAVATSKVGPVIANSALRRLLNLPKA